MTMLNPKRWNGWTLTAVALFVFAGCCFSPRVLSLLRQAEPVAQAATGTALRPITRPIEELQPGDRVLAHNPEVTDAERLVDDPDPATWRLLTLELTSGDGHRFDIRLLRPVEWVTANEAVAGGTVWLEMPEIGLSADANVTSIEPCPPIKPGRGRVITGTFRHESADTVNVAIEGQPPLGCTGNHPFWSEDRHDFIQARQLHPGERLKTVDNHQVRVTSITPRPHTEPVYNLEVDVEHVYYVGDGGVLVHNSGGERYLNPAPGRMISEGGRYLGGEVYQDFVVYGRSVRELFSARLEGRKLTVTWTETLGIGGETLGNRLRKVQSMAGGTDSFNQIVGQASDALRDLIKSGAVKPEDMAKLLGAKLGGRWSVKLVPRPNSVPPTWDVIAERL